MMGADNTGWPGPRWSSSSDMMGVDPMVVRGGGGGGGRVCTVRLTDVKDL